MMAGSEKFEILIALFAIRLAWLFSSLCLSRIRSIYV